MTPSEEASDPAKPVQPLLLVAALAAGLVGGYIVRRLMVEERQDLNS